MEGAPDLERIRNGKEVWFEAFPTGIVQSWPAVWPVADKGMPICPTTWLFHGAYSVAETPQWPWLQCGTLILDFDFRCAHLRTAKAGNPIRNEWSDVDDDGTRDAGPACRLPVANQNPPGN
jgi:hypothetical protein